MIEFAVVGPLFLVLSIMVAQVALMMVAQTTLDFSVDAAGRQVQLGYITDAGSYRSAVCGGVTAMPDCMANLQLTSTSGSSFAAQTSTPPFGDSNTYVLLTAKYHMPWLMNFGLGTSGTDLVSTVAYSNEPFGSP